jgi:uncharacterized protein YacL
MDITLIILLLIAAETSYLAYQTFKSRQVRLQHQSILLDTSVLIDGRIESIARSGLVTAPLVVPRSVVRELQYMADKADHDKRERARFGLDMIEKLQSIEGVDITIIEDDPLTDGGVDERLVTLAKASSARLCTTDYNLNKAARVQGVIVLNINEIAHALRIVRLPGEKVTIVLQQAGQERDQAVGHLDDGTMVVVDNGKSHIGEDVEVEITRALQTVAGKMLFARLASAPQQSPRQKASPKPRRAQQKHGATDQKPVPVPTQAPAVAPQPTAEASKPQREASEPRNARPAKQPRRRKSMTDRAEDSLVDLLNKQ